MMALSDSMTRRFVKVAPPSVHAGVGDALRLAFRMRGEDRSPRRLNELLDRLN